MKTLGYLLFIIIAISACKNYNTDAEKPVAKFSDRYLFLNEIKDVVPNESSNEDSLLIANSYINQWITKQLLLQKAELNLSQKEKDVSKLIEDYRTSLIIHRYKQKLIEQKLDFNFSDKQLKDYYDKYKFNFSLPNNIIKATYIKLPINAPDLDRIRKIYKSEKAKNQEELENYCLSNAKKFDDFNGEWIPTYSLLNYLPIKIDDKENYLKNHKYIEVKDEEYIYFVKVIEFREINTQAPFEYIKDNLIEILKNKKKIEFETELEKEINKEAKEKNMFTIY